MLTDLFTHRGSALLSHEQSSFFLQDVMNNTEEMSNLLQQLHAAAPPDIAGQCAHLLHLNKQISDNLEQIQKSLK